LHAALSGHLQEMDLWTSPLSSGSLCSRCVKLPQALWALISESFFSVGVSIYISAFTLMAIAIDRYFVILHPFKSRMQMQTCVLVVVTIWITASILTFPYAHFMEFWESEVDNGTQPETMAPNATS